MGMNDSCGRLVGVVSGYGLLVGGAVSGNEHW